MTDWDESDAFEAASTASLSAQAMAVRGQADTSYLDGLNPQQLEAVKKVDGPVLMLAGAGTGKTKALTARIAHLLNIGHARPNEILAVTFTNKAAKEMKTRVSTSVGGVVEGMPWMGTFHSICVKLLRRHAELAGLKSNFTILDTDDQIRLLKQLIRAENIDEKRWPARMLASHIDSWKNRALSPEMVPNSEASHYNGRGAEFYALYQARLLTLNAVDFGDLLLHVVRIFQTHSDVLAQYQRWFKYILVDEYQDTNVAQYLWLRLLASGHKNICCVGDDDQSIYGWRGAEVGNILKFEKDFPGAKVIRLEQNYRSTPHILKAASSVISGNENRLGKTLWTAETEGEKVRLIGHWDGDEEARWIGEEIEAYQRGTRGQDPVPLDGMAILVRASFLMRAFEDRFLSIGIPYRVIGGPRFYERLEIRDAMAYFRVVVSPDDGLAFERIVNTPKRGLGDKAQQMINNVARQNGVSLLEGARIVVDEKLLPKRAGNSLGKLVESFDRWRSLLDGPAPIPINEQISDFDVIDDDTVVAESPNTNASNLTHVELAEIILDESGYTDYWKNDKSPDAAGRLENLKELVKALEEFENFQGFLEHISLVMENAQDDAGEKVSIMTLHGAKGLEFPCVFLPGWEEGLFPSQRTMDESGKKGVEEERRLAYVGITRAEEICTISFVANRRIYNQWQTALPSRFIDELPADHVDVLTPPGLYGGSFGSAANKNFDGVMRASDLETRAQKADVYNSPGWKRMQSRTQRPHANPAVARNVVDAEVVPFGLGDRVFHQKFGYGAVIEVDGDKLTVAFEKAGQKKVIASYVTGAGEVPF
ncbi:MAG: UvrD-helicase domain-containing protein [Rhodobacteraceae bacterium]|nr:UvrD-helicase domain-containing protein [Paracoccaceae bacterium]